jgi:transcriptional regulator with XRE-family HTH domain
MNFGDRMRTEALRKGIKLPALAKAIGVTPNRLYRWGGENAKLPSDVLVIERVAEILEVSPEWLVFGRDRVGPMPVGYYVGAGDEVHTFEGDAPEFTDCPGADPLRHIIAEVRGESMVPYVDHRDYVMAVKEPAYSPESVAREGLPAIVAADTGAMWLKRIRVRRGQKATYDLLSFNTAFDPIENVGIEWCAPVIRRWSPIFGEVA